MTETRVAHLQSLYRARKTEQTHLLLAAFSPDIDWEMVGRKTDFPAFGKRKGRDAVEAFFETVRQSGKFTAFETGRFHVTGDTIFVDGQYTFEVARTRKSITTPFLHVFTFDGEKIVAFREFIDTAQLAEAYRLERPVRTG